MDSPTFILRWAFYRVLQCWWCWCCSYCKGYQVSLKKNPKTLCIFCSLCWNTFLCPKCHSLEDEAQKSLLLILYPGCSTMVKTLPLCLQWQDLMSQLKPSLQSIVTVHPFYTHQIANIKVQSINISWLNLILSLFFSLALVEIIVLAL